MSSSLPGPSLSLFESLAWSSEMRTLITKGLLGAFTPYSTLSYEAAVLLEEGEWVRNDQADRNLRIAPLTSPGASSWM